MQLTGEIVVGTEEYLFHFILNRRGNRWSFYRKHTGPDRLRLLDGQRPLETVLSPTLLEGNHNYPNHLVATLRTTLANNKLEYYGDTQLIENFLTVYYELLRNPDTDEKYRVVRKKEFAISDHLTDFQTELYTMRTVTRNEKITTIRAFTGIKVDTPNKLDFKISAFAEKMKANNYKTLLQLMDIKDLTFCLDYSTMELTRDYRIINDIESFNRVLEELGNDNITFVALDTETTGLQINSLPKNNPNKDRIVGMSLTWRMKQAIYIPFDHTKFDNLDKAEVLAKLMPVLAKKKLITHNGLFDGKVLYDEGYKITIAHDTQLLAFHINPKVGKGNTALKSLTFKRYGDETLELDDIFPRKDDAGLFRHLPYDLVRIYACCDTDYTYQLLFDMFDDLTRINPKQVALYETDCKVASYLYVDEYYGNRIDSDLLIRHSNANDKDLQTLETLMHRYAAQVGLVTQETKRLQLSGMDSSEVQEEVQKLLNHPEFDNLSKNFSVTSSKDLNQIVFDLLEYPITRVSEKTGEPSIDKFAIKDLLRERNNEPNNWLKGDVPSALTASGIQGLDADDLVLIRKEEFDYAKYPFAVLLNKYRELDKLRSGFFNGLLEKNTDGLYYTGYRLTSADTARIINPIQTLKGALKKLIVPYSTDYYLFVFDFAAIEYRVMMALAGYQEIIDVLNNPEADYHREVGASMMSTTPEDMTSKERGDIKSVNFAVPYGMGPFSLGQNLARGRKEAFTRAHVEEAILLLAKWRKSNVLLYNTLEAYRKVAVEEGVCENPLGRRKYFDIGSAENPLTSKEVGGIKRQAGNYPIQSYAREIFAIAYVRLKKIMESKGLLEVREDTNMPSIMIPNLVHDEMVCQVHKSIHPYQMYTWIEKACMLRMKGHPVYFAGMNVVDNWYQGKDDMYEAPIRFAWEQIEDFKNNPLKYQEQTQKVIAGETTYTKSVLHDIERYMYKRYVLETSKLQPDFGKRKTEDGTVVLDLAEIMPKYKDYFLKPKMAKYIVLKRKANKKTEDIIWACFESVALDLYGKVHVIYPNGNEETIEANTEVKEKDEFNFDFGLDEIATGNKTNIMGGEGEQEENPTDDDDEIDLGLFDDIDEKMEYRQKEEMFAELAFDEFDDLYSSEDFSRTIPAKQDFARDDKFNYNEELMGTGADYTEILGISQTVNTFNLNHIMIVDTDDVINFLLTDYKIEKVKELIEYLKTIKLPKGSKGSMVRIILKDGKVDFPVPVGQIDNDKVASIFEKDFMSMNL